MVEEKDFMQRTGKVIMLIFFRDTSQIFTLLWFVYFMGLFIAKFIYDPILLH